MLKTQISAHKYAHKCTHLHSYPVSAPIGFVAVIFNYSSLSIHHDFIIVKNQYFETRIVEKFYDHQVNDKQELKKPALNNMTFSNNPNQIIATNNLKKKMLRNKMMKKIRIKRLKSRIHV